MKKRFNCIIKTLSKLFKSNLMIRILTGVIIGAILALICPQYKGITFLGTLFVGALKAVAPILVFILVTSSISKAQAGLGKKFRKIIFLYIASTFIAAILAVFASRTFPVSIMLSDIAGASNAAPGALGEVFRNIVNEVVSNPVKAIMNANYLSILFWAIITGLSLKKLANENTIGTRLCRVCFLDCKMDYTVCPSWYHGTCLWSRFRKRTGDFHHLRQTFVVACRMYVGNITHYQSNHCCSTNKTQPLSFAVAMP